MEVIAGHPNTDFDAFASMLACRRLYPHAVVVLTGSLNRNVREFARLHADELDLVDAARIDPARVTRLVLVELRDPAKLGELASALRPGVEVALFDHHSEPLPEWLPPETAVVSGDGALTTTLCGILAEREIAVSALEATAFALGIHEDTGSLTYASATLRDAEALTWCLRHGARQDMVARYLHQPLVEDERGLLDALLAALEPESVAGHDVLVGALAWPRYVDGVSNLAHKLVDLTDARGLVCLVEMDGRVVAVFRSRMPELDASVLAAALGGGGHAQAASASFHGTLADARARVLEALPGAVREAPRAVDVMSRPARFVAPDDTVAHTMALCQRYRQSGIQVGGRRRLVGIVTREDLDKAIGHGLSNAPVKAIMSSDVVTCSDDTPLGELRRLVAASQAGRVPVIRDGEVIGVVTRGDVLRGLGEPEPEADEKGRDLGAMLMALPGLEPVFEAIQAVSGGFDGVYLVGGTVRDILLGEEQFDLDIAVEGDGIAFGRALAGTLGGRVTPHEKFGTAIVRWAGGRVDVATARTEFYDEPAALPTVEHATIRQDLFRRDFTVNAMAVSLRGGDFGRLADFFGGLADLEQRVLRVLHNLSFIDDPTRIFRAIRYENRYGFRMDGHTVALARACVEMGLVGELSSARLRDELVALLSEQSVADSVRRLGELGLAEAVHPHLAVDAETAELLERADEPPRALRAGRAGVAPPAGRARAPAPAGRALRLVLPASAPPARRRPRGRRGDGRPEASGPARRRRATFGGAAAARAARPARGAARARPRPGRRRVPTGSRRYLDELRGVRLEITGADLDGLGLHESPRVGEVLTELLRRRLDGELTGGREAELAAARDLVAVEHSRQAPAPGSA